MLNWLRPRKPRNDSRPNADNDANNDEPECRNYCPVRLAECPEMLAELLVSLGRDCLLDDCTRNMVMDVNEIVRCK